MKKGKLSMRKVKEILRLKFSLGLSNRQISRSVKSSHNTVSYYVKRAELSGISWPLPEGLDDEELSIRLFGKGLCKKRGSKPLPDFGYVHKELSRKGVTLQLLWEEYREVHPDGYGYSQFCEHYQRFRKSQEFCLRQHYKGGDKLFVDYAGQTVPIHNSITGEVTQAQLFVACLGASNYSYAEATWTQSLPDWINSHINAYEYFQGVPKATIPDNLKSAVNRSCRYDPDINPTYREMAEHYGTAIVPARAYKPRDKAKVESGVLVVERWIIAALRNYKFFSLQELNKAIWELLGKLNNRPFKKLAGCRADLFKELDQPALNPLPEKRYEYADWKQVTVNIDYHVEIEKRYYSVPYQLIHKKLDVRITSRTIEIFYKNRRVASHVRNLKQGSFTTLEIHRPKKHREYLKWNPGRLLNWSLSIGPQCIAFIKALLNSRKYPEQSFRSCLGVLRLSKSYPKERVEKACKRALLLQVYSYKIIESILKRNKDKEANKTVFEISYKNHENIRGNNFYQ